MPEKAVEYVIRIGLRDRYRHLHIQKKGKIVLDIKGRVKKTPLFNQDYNDALSFAECDLKSNWLFYKRAFVEDSQDG